MSARLVVISIEEGSGEHRHRLARMFDLDAARQLVVNAGRSDAEIVGGVYEELVREFALKKEEA